MKRKLYMLLAGGLIGGCISLGIVFYIYEWNRIPDRIYIETGTEEKLSFRTPVKGTVYSIEEDAIETASGQNQGMEINFVDDFIITTEENKTYKAKLKLLGFLPYKSVEITGVEPQEMIPLGNPIGLYIKMDGVLVIDIGSFTSAEGEEASPCSGLLQEGDYITEINGVPIAKKSEVISFVESADEKGLLFKIVRGRESFETRIYPVKGQDNTNKIGLWIRDSLQGIGTLTAMDSKGNYVALGHGITDCDTGDLASLSYGAVYKTSILGIKNGQKGEPGELSGVIQYEKSNLIGNITMNSDKGIAGSISSFTSLDDQEPLPIGYKQEVKTGEAFIMCDLEEPGKLYTIDIKKVNVNSLEDKKGITFQVTDDELLELSGGIVQGMSGSPIIQDGKIIGAVTHVFINDPTKGYGIFIENMLEHDN